jgi:phospholipid transport system substrate-binding protein
MSRILKPVLAGLLLAAAPGALVLTAPPAVAQSSADKASDPAASQIQDFYDALVAAMKAGGSAKSRYEKLKPAVEKAFDLQAMTAAAVGPTFATLPDADKKALTDAFERMTIANYAKNFDSYSGEKFVVEPQSVARGSEHFVKSRLQPSSGEAIAFNYRMHEAGGAWKVTDVYLAGNISQMAQKRSDFASTFASGGAAGLTKRMNALTDQMLG